MLNMEEKREMKYLIEIKLQSMERGIFRFKVEVMVKLGKQSAYFRIIIPIFDGLNKYCFKKFYLEREKRLKIDKNFEKKI